MVYVTEMQTISNHHRLRFGLLLLTGFLVCAVATGCAERSNLGGEQATGSAVKRFMFLTNGDDPFWDALGAGLAEGAKQQGLESKRLRAVLEKNNGTAQGQIEKLRQFASQSDIAGVAISVIQAENAAIVEEMKNLAAKGVKVITVDGDVNRATFRDARPHYIGTDNIAGGRLLGAAAKKLFASRGQTSGSYVQFAGFTDNDNARTRMNGFKEAAGDAYREVDRMSDEMDLSKARDNVRSALVNHPDLAGLVGIWAYNAPAIAEVTEERGARGRLTIVTFDAQAAAIEHMAGGRIDAMLVQNPFEMGVQTVRLLTALHEGDEATVKEMFPRAGEVDGDLYTTGLRLIVPDANTPLEAAAFSGDGVEVMSLSTFRDWLAKHGLSSS
jgi:ribose transport system substrate-binding protein